MRDLLKSPDDFYHHIMRTTCSIACSMVWGHRGATYDSFFGHVSDLVPLPWVQLTVFFSQCVYDAMESVSTPFNINVYLKRPLR